MLSWDVSTGKLGVRHVSPLVATQYALARGLYTCIPEAPTANALVLGPPPRVLYHTVEPLSLLTFVALVALSRDWKQAVAVRGLATCTMLGLVYDE